MLVSGHIDASYNGQYTQIGLWNQRSAYRSNNGRVLYFYDLSLSSDGGSSAWQFDNRDQDNIAGTPGTHNWYRGGGIAKSDEGSPNPPLGTNNWDVRREEGTGGAGVLTITALSESQPYPYPYHIPPPSLFEVSPLNTTVVLRSLLARWQGVRHRTQPARRRSHNRPESFWPNWRHWSARPD